MNTLVALWMVLTPTGHVYPLDDNFPVGNQLSWFCEASQNGDTIYKVASMKNKVMTVEFRFKCVGEDSGRWTYRIVTSK